MEKCQRRSKQLQSTQKRFRPAQDYDTRRDPKTISRDKCASKQEKRNQAHDLAQFDILSIADQIIIHPNSKLLHTSMAFVQREVPQLNLISTFTENNKITNLDFCPHLITAAQAPDSSDILYVVYVAKVGYICMVVMEIGCIMAKNTIQIQYSYNWRITSLNLQVVKEEEEDSKLSKGTYLFIGYEDGSISMHMLIEGGNRPMARIFKIKPKLKKKQIIVKASIWRNNLILTTGYNIFVYHRMFLKQQIRLKQSPLSPSKVSSKSPSKSTQQRRPQDTMVRQQQLKIQINECKLNTQINYSSDVMYVFNQLQGAVCYNLNNLSQVMKIQDSIKILYTGEGLTHKTSNIVVIGGTDDSIKFIDYNSNIVQKFIGFKNYPSCFQEDLYNHILWVGCLDGSISCFSFKKRQIQKKKTFIMHQTKLLYSKKINENGIKKIIVHKQTLIILDCHHNIEFYDIVMASLSTDRYNSSNYLQGESSGREIEEVRIGRKSN